MVTVDSKFYQKKKNSSFYVGVGFLAFTIIITIALYIYDTRIERENEELASEIVDFDTRIAEQRNDKNVQVYSIYEKNKGLLETLSARSEIPLFVSHLQKNFQKYELEGKGFNY
ncbi:hypothetical protein N9J72_03325, partial [Candidatus Gracilibacteria bacterium]|nr:hypothetical protein [Candidatus Gracilibacteria bacterium]